MVRRGIPRGVEVNPASAKRIRHAELLADTGCRGILDLSMAGNRAATQRGWIVVDAMLLTLAHENAAVILQVPD